MSQIVVNIIKIHLPQEQGQLQVVPKTFQGSGAFDTNGVDFLTQTTGTAGVTFF